MKLLLDTLALYLGSVIGHIYLLSPTVSGLYLRKLGKNNVEKTLLG